MPIISYKNIKFQTKINKHRYEISQKFYTPTQENIYNFRKIQQKYKEFLKNYSKNMKQLYKILNKKTNT